MGSRVRGLLYGLVTLAIFSGAMLSVRGHLSVATCALILVIPVVVGVATGGFVAGLFCVAAGFLVYDILFIPPYGTLTVGNLQNWVALIVYVVVMVAVAQVFANLERARAATQQRANNARLLFNFSEQLLGEQSLMSFPKIVTDALCTTFSLGGAQFLLAVGEDLSLVATSGTITESGSNTATDSPIIPGTLSRAGSTAPAQTLPLLVGDRPIGLLVLHGLPSDSTTRELFPVLSNHVALALERTRLHERALHAELLEEIGRLQRELFGAVSHDLRSPLATIKVASSTLLAPSEGLREEDRWELYELIDAQTDRLTRLVTGLLDMTRIQAGVLELHRERWDLDELVRNVIEIMRPSLDQRTFCVDLATAGREIMADRLLLEQVFTNLIDNAHRHAPVGTPITITSRCDDSGQLIVSVIDQGVGVPIGERERLFESFVRFDTGGRAGLGLAIVNAFIVAHGGRIWVEAPVRGGACFSFVLSNRVDEQTSALSERD